VALVGARQVGKTTLARSLGGSYYDLEQESDRVRVDLEWEVITRSRKLTILDEAQAWPQVFPRLRAAIDDDRKRPNRFLLLGSVSPRLMLEVSESLAGRLALVEISPFVVSELPRRYREELWLKGGYPDGGVLGGGGFPRWQQDYLTLLSRRDLPNWGLPAQPALTDRLFKMLAIGHGQVWNASALGRSLGISYHTVTTYVDYLEGAFLVRRLQPYAANLRKRLTKSPKLYWRDSGLVHALLGVRTREDLLVQPWVGASFEGWVVDQVIGHLTSQGRSFEAFYLRTVDGLEIDLVLELAPRRWAIEVKLTSSPGPGDLDKLRRNAELIAADRICLVSRTAHTARGEHELSTDLAGLLEALDGE
jgi:hypothetical protein